MFIVSFNNARRAVFRTASVVFVSCVDFGWDYRNVNMIPFYIL